MHEPLQDLVLKVIRPNEQRMLSEWMNLINEHVPSPRRITKARFAHIINDICKYDYALVRERIEGNIYYTFISNKSP